MLMKTLVYKMGKKGGGGRGGIGRKKMGWEGGRTPATPFSLYSAPLTPYIQLIKTLKNGDPDDVGSELSYELSILWRYRQK